MEDKKTLNKVVILVVITAVALVLAIAGTATAVVALVSVNNVKQQLVAKEDDGETREDDVIIAENYEIKSTLDISEAYKSGNSSKLDDKQKETLDIASDILKDIITEGMTDYEKEKAVYDWMCKTLTFDAGSLVAIPEADEECDNPYGALKYHKAVCVGYATTFRLFMQMMDIECKVVHNSECFHSWDLVNIEDNWYHVDIYSDAGVGNYANFNVNDKIRETAQNWDREFFPEATSLDMNPAYKERVILASVDDIPATMLSLIKNKQMLVYLELPSNPTEADTYKADYYISMMDGMFCESGFVANMPMGIGSRIQFEPEDNKVAFIIGFTDYWGEMPAESPEEPDEPIVSDQELDAMRDKLYSVFGELGYTYFGGVSGEEIMQ